AAADVVGKRVSEVIIPPSLRAAHEEGLRRYFATGEGRVIGKRIEIAGMRADGTQFPAELAITRLPGAGAALFTCFLRDLSGRKELEAQLQQAQRMEAVGRLAGGVAHDFNNILTVIISYSEMLLGEPELSDPIRADLVQVRTAADRAAALTRQLLAFSRKQVLHPTVLDINEIVNDVMAMLSRVMPSDIRLQSKLSVGVDPIYVDRGQLEQVIMNLAVNARDAMPTGGSLIFETGNSMLDDTYVALHHGAMPGAHTVLSVRDTGIGMDEETRERIFEPFFTTKPVGQGTGLGLATVYGIVQQSGGSIYVYSEPDRGTTFKVYFPRHAGTPAASEMSAPTELAAGTSANVLLVEDDPAVRGAGRIVLERLGHRVVEAPDVATALGLIRSSGERFDVVLTDSVMPGQSGQELADILGAERPEIPVILMSGYSEEAVRNSRGLPARVVFLEKPFSGQMLARTLNEVLARSPAGTSGNGD
ncbi:MAG: sensor protein, partial [Gemmatimonadetes bacterium]|nr:sensor protein [Gemmatimonadota bacterium]